LAAPTALTQIALTVRRFLWLAMPLRVAGSAEEWRATYPNAFVRFQTSKIMRARHPTGEFSTVS